MIDKEIAPSRAVGPPSTFYPSPSTLLAPLTAHVLRFTVEAIDPILLNEHKGSALRGAFFNALRDRFCHNRNLTSCLPCPVHAACPICTLVATVDEAGQRGVDPPRPFVVQPPLDDKTRYLPGDTLDFGFTLFGDALKLFPYVVVAFQEAGQRGIGKKVPSASFRPLRGRFTIRKVEAINPLTGEIKPVKSDGDDTIRVPNVPVTHANVMEKIQGMQGRGYRVEGRGYEEKGENGLVPCTLYPIPYTLIVRFLTPVRLVDGGRLVNPIRFRPLVQRLFERLSGLAAYYAGSKEAVRFVDLLALAERIEVVEDRTWWVELESYSARHGRATPLGGHVGSITFAGDIAPFLPYLVWGQFTHVGKDATKGNGSYRLEGIGDIGG